MKRQIRNIFRKIFYQRYYNWWDSLHKNLLNDTDIRLTNNEKESVDALHNRFTNLNLGYTFYETVKLLDKFDINYIQDTLYFSYILRQLNPLEHSKTFSDKSFYNFYFKQINRPFEPVRLINGQWYDSENRCVSEGVALDILLNYNKEIIVKPTGQTGRGRGIEFCDKYDGTILKSLVSRFGDNFVVQEIVSQSVKTSIFNPTSLNCFRITTLLLNGSFSILSRCLKTGAKNSKIDNIGVKDEGGIIVGINADGKFHEYGITKEGKKTRQSSCGVLFEGYYLPEEIGKIDLFVQELHERIPFCAIVGWDICLDKSDNPLLIEVNLLEPGILYEQLCTGPIFGERTEEVFDYVTRNGAVNMWINHFKRS